MKSVPFRLRADFLDLRSFGAVGDDVTDDTAKIQTAVDTAIAQGKKLYVPRGRYRYTSTITANGSIQLFGDGPQSLFRGERIYGPYNLDIGQGFRFQPAFSATSYTATGQALAAGASALTLNTVAGLAIGDEVLLSLGVDVIDPTLPDYLVFAHILGIAGLVVTFDTGTPRAINGTSHTLSKVTASCHNTLVENLGFSRGWPGFIYAQQGLARNLYFETGYFAINAAWCFGQRFENIHIDEALSAPDGHVQVGTYGSPVYIFTNYGFHAENVRIRKQQACTTIDNDGGGERGTFDNFSIDLCPVAGGPTGQVYAFRNSPSFRGPMLIRNCKVNRIGTAGGTVSWYLGGTDKMRFENLEIDGDEAVPFDGFAPVAISRAACLHGRFRMNAHVFNGPRHFRRLIPLTPSMNVNVDLGVCGLLHSVRVFASDTAHITLFGDNLTGVPNFLATNPLTAGKFVDCDLISGGYSSRQFPDTLLLDVQTDAGVVAGSFVVIEGEYLAHTDTRDKSKEVIVGDGAPGGGAAFLEQRYFDVTNSLFYIAKASTGSPTDWVPMTPAITTFASWAAADFPVVASVALADVPGLAVTLGGSGFSRYKFRAVVWVTCSAAGGHKWDLTYSGGISGSDVRYTFNAVDLNAAGPIIRVSEIRAAAFGGANVHSHAGETAVQMVIEGCIAVQSGTLKIKFAQDVASGTSTVLQNSFLVVERIG